MSVRPDTRFPLSHQSRENQTPVYRLFRGEGTERELFVAGHVNER
jgi:hypothetical protein